MGVRKRASGAVLAALVGMAGTSCVEDEAEWREEGDRSACIARPPGSGAIVVHYGAHGEKNPAPSFLDALAGDAETVIVTRALAPDCAGGPFAYWRGKGDRFRWAYKIPDDDAATKLANDTFVDFVRDRIDEGWDYVAIDEINANPNAQVKWTNGTANAERLADAMEELTATGYGRRMMLYFAGSTVSNPDRSQQIRDILQAVPTHTRIGMLELYRYTSDAHTVEQHRAYFHDKARNFEMAVPGINDHIIAVLGIVNKDSHAYTYLDVPADDMDSLFRQFSALHQANSLTRRHPGVGAYTWGATRHREPHYGVHDLAAGFRDLSNWYAVHFGVDAAGVDDPADPANPADPAACNEPHEADVGGVCIPSCGAAGGNTCLGGGNHACDPYGALEAYDCAVCCARPELLTVYRGYDPQRRSHKYALSSHDASVGGYQLEGATFSLARDGGLDRAALVQCLKTNDRLLYTTAADCEGMGTLHGPLGHVATTQVAGTRALHRLYHSGNGAHFYAAGDADKDAALALGYKYEGVVGYVW